MSTVSIQSTTSAAPGILQVTINIDIPTPINAISKIALASGLNTITIPTGTTLIIVQLPVGNTQTVTLKGVTGDTGILLNKTGVAAFQPDSSDTTFVLTAGGAISALTTITFL